MNKPYPEVGDLVHYWRADPPPLSQTYVAPECLHALVVSLSEPDENYRQMATLAVVTPEGLLVTEVLRMESFATTSQDNGYRQSDRNYGVSASWHSWEHDRASSPLPAAC